MLSRSPRPLAAFLALILALPLMSACGGPDGPGEEPVTRAVLEELGDGWELDDFTVEASENIGDEVEPVWKMRFRTDAELEDAVYQADPGGDYAGATMMERVADEGREAELYGVAEGRVSEGEWEVDVDFQTDVSDLPSGLTRDSMEALVAMVADSLRNSSNERLQKVLEMRKELGIPLEGPVFGRGEDDEEIAEYRREWREEKWGALYDALYDGETLTAELDDEYGRALITVESFDEQENTLEGRIRWPDWDGGPVKRFTGELSDQMGLAVEMDLEETGFIQKTPGAPLLEYHLESQEPLGMLEGDASDISCSYWCDRIDVSLDPYNQP